MSQSIYGVTYLFFTLMCCISATPFGSLNDSVVGGASSRIGGPGCLLGRGVDLQSLLRRTGVPVLLYIAVLELACDASSDASAEMWRFILLSFMRGLTGDLICSFIIRATLAL